MGLHWVDSHFGFGHEDYAGNYTTNRADREWFTKDYDPFNDAFGCDMDSPMGCDSPMGAEHLASFNGDSLAFGNIGALAGAGAGAALMSGGLNMAGLTAGLPVLGAAAVGYWVGNFIDKHFA